MLTKSKWILLSLALVFALALTGCEDINSGTQVSEGDAEEPVITKQPVGGSYTLGSSDAKLKVEAEVDDGGTLSYQWYTADEEQYASGEGTAIAGATGAEYSIGLAEGVYRIYVVVTNTKGETTASAKSELVRVVINDPANAQYPWISSEPASTAYVWTAGLAVDPLSVTATVTDGGTLTYQWYSSTSYTTTGATLIQGAAGASYQPAITAEGTSYYYAVVTNTKADAPGRTVSTIESSIAVVKALTPKSTITVDGTKAQYVRGFGVMANFWGNSPDVSLSDYEKMFNPGKLGYTMLRIMVPVDAAEGSTDMRVIMAKTLNNELSGDKDRSNYYDMVKMVNKYKGFVLASPWSPPPPWKTNNSANGGGAGAKAELKKEFWPDYADYLKEYCKIMYENGAPVYAVSIQNEPNFAASYDGCEWTGAQMRDFFKQVGRFTEGVKGWGGGQEIPTVLTMFGESANSPTDSDYGLNDPEASQYIDLYARHLYGSQQVVRSKEAQAQGKEIWMTEHNVNGGNAATYPNDSTYNYIWKFLNDIDVSIRLNKENAFIWWYGKRFYSMIGDGDYGTVDGAILPRGYALSHYAKYASDTWQVGVAISGGSSINNSSFDIDSTTAKVTAFVSPDGNSLSLVMWTPTTTSGTGGTDMGDVKIDFPAGFAATKVTATRTKDGAWGKPDGESVLIKGGASAFVSLHAGEILSVRFTK